MGIVYTDLRLANDARPDLEEINAMALVGTGSSLVHPGTCCFTTATVLIAAAVLLVPATVYPEAKLPLPEVFVEPVVSKKEYGKVNREEDELEKRVRALESELDKLKDSVIQTDKKAAAAAADAAAAKEAAAWAEAKAADAEAAAMRAATAAEEANSKLDRMFEPMRRE